MQKACMIFVVQLAAYRLLGENKHPSVLKADRIQIGWQDSYLKEESNRMLGTKNSSALRVAVAPPRESENTPAGHSLQGNVSPATNNKK